MTRRGDVGLFDLIAFHAPPLTRNGDTFGARREAYAAIRAAVTARAGTPWGVLADWNSGTEQDDLADYGAGVVAGDGIDAGVFHGFRVVSWQYVTRVGRGRRAVTLRSDHRHALRVKLKATGLWARLFTRSRTVWWYNVEVGRPNGQVAGELQAILKSKPLAVLLCETVGYDLPQVDTHTQVRDRRTESRANVTGYVRRGHLRSSGWHDMARTWARTDHPGAHPPRSFLELAVTWRPRR